MNLKEERKAAEEYAALIMSNKSSNDIFDVQELTIVSSEQRKWTCIKDSTTGGEWYCYEHEMR